MVDAFGAVHSAQALAPSPGLFVYRTHCTQAEEALIASESSRPLFEYGVVGSVFIAQHAVLDNGINAVVAVSLRT
jgi:hypothetical protein